MLCLLLCDGLEIDVGQFRSFCSLGFDECEEIQVGISRSLIPTGPQITSYISCEIGVPLELV